jgi:hypothetical protein
VIVIGWVSLILVLVLYCTGYLLFWRTAVWWWFVGLESSSRKPDYFDIACGIVVGSVVAALWPLILAYQATQSICRGREEEALCALSPRGVRRERERREREENIARLELELGIGHDLVIEANAESPAVEGRS